MVVIAKIKFSESDKIYKSLNKIFGIGKGQINSIIRKLGFNRNYYSFTLSDVLEYSLLFKLDSLLLNNLIGAELRKDLYNNIAFLKKIHSYRGFRHSSGLPSRGQRTKTNASTVRKLNKKLK